ncbi:cupin domain-containing protein [Dyella silvae]|uniref:cupin domain-containing protein n=1 Tax=Dyella silvae TaxID=2994424 RepID=UPI002264CFF1|nr:cupin domain-containing protein [Dyella silvae]
MTPIRLINAASELPEAWSSCVLAAIGDACLKLLRMDEAAYPEECHDYAEGLLVLDGEMVLSMQGTIMRVGAGELCIVPAGVPHSVAPGSRSTLLILDS